MSDSMSEWGQNTDAAIKQRIREMCQSEKSNEDISEVDKKFLEKTLWPKEQSAANPYPQAIKEMSSRLARLNYILGVLDMCCEKDAVRDACREYLEDMKSLVLKG